MTPKQERFCSEYLASGNATDAARRAGYSSRTAYSQGQRLLKKVEVQERLKEMSEEIRSEKILTAEQVMEHLSAVVKGTVTEFVMTPSGKVMELPVRESDRLSASDKLLKIYGSYRPQAAVSKFEEEYLAAFDAIEAEEDYDRS